MAPPTPTKVLLTTTLQPLVMELSGPLAHGARLVEQFLKPEPSPDKMMLFERELGALVREVGRRRERATTAPRPRPSQGRLREPRRRSSPRPPPARAHPNRGRGRS